MSTPPPALILLAAGASSRLGTAKALVRYSAEPGHTALELLLAAGSAAGDAHPLVVTGAWHERIAACVPAGIEVVRNAAWELGRTGSVACALTRRPGRDVLLAPVDVPLVPREVFAALAEEWARRGSPARGWLAPCVRLPGEPRSRHGHPVLVGRALCEIVKGFPPERPLSAARALAEPLLSIEVARPEILDDVDTPADVARLRRRLRLAGG